MTTPSKQPKTLSEKLIAELEYRGYVKAPSRSKHPAYWKPELNNNKIYFVLRNGALRVGLHISSSISVPNRAKTLLDAYALRMRIGQ